MDKMTRKKIAKPKSATLHVHPSAEKINGLTMLKMAESRCNPNSKIIIIMQDSPDAKWNLYQGGVSSAETSQILDLAKYQAMSDVLSGTA